MSIDTTFHPLTPSVAIVSGSPLQVNAGAGGQIGVTTFRIATTTAANASTRISWGPTAASAAVPTVAGSNVAYIPGNGVLYIELPPNVFFNTQAVGTVEITGGIGGVGG
jgi:hypothetical protein